MKFYLRTMLSLLTITVAWGQGAPATSADWVKSSGNPVMQGTQLILETVVDDNGTFKAWLDIRSKRSIGYAESKDGIHWTEPVVVLSPVPGTWEDHNIDRPYVVKKGKIFHMWYTVHSKERKQQENHTAAAETRIAYATSTDGLNWKRMSDKPVLSATEEWENSSVMCPVTIWDKDEKCFKMWYSAGGAYEPTDRGYAVSKDGLNWTKRKQPVFSGTKNEKDWDGWGIAGGSVIKRKGQYYMFYIGYKNISHAQTGIARSKDGITNWERYKRNPIVSPDMDYDKLSVYITQVIYREKEKRWYLWYSGRNKTELPCLVTKDGEDLNFDTAQDKYSNTIISPSVVKEYTERFNQKDDELYKQFIPNDKAADFLAKNIPCFECPDKELEEIYYFRWWTYRKHIKQTPEGFVITEFLPNVRWAGKYNCINGDAVYHYREGRWIHNHEYLSAYTHYWFREGGAVRSYSCPMVYAIYNDFLVTGDDTLIKEYYADLVKYYEDWEGDHFDVKHGLFWQIDDRDWGELTIAGHGLRPLINSFMIGDAIALSKIAKHLGDIEQQKRFEKKASDLQKVMWNKLWDKDAQFYKVVQLWEKHPTNMGQRGSLKKTPTVADVRELYGYAPWMFGIAKPEHNVAWKFLMDDKHFYAPYGPSFAEQCHPAFTISYEGHECQWNGPSWPMSTTLTLLGLANLLQTEQQNVITKNDYLDLLKVYAHSHHLKLEDGTVVPWIDENLNPFTGDWIARTRLKTWKNGTWDAGKGGVERGKDYNHSEFCDLIISGLVGLRPAEGGNLTIHPLLPQGVWDYFCLENVLYHGKLITVIYDKTGKKYGKGKGLSVLVDGKKVASSPDLSVITCKLK